MLWRIPLYQGAVWQCTGQWALATCRVRVGRLNKHPTWRERGGVGSWILGLFEPEALHGGILQPTAPSLIDTLFRVLDPISTLLQAGRQASHHHHFTWLPPRSQTAAIASLVCKFSYVHTCHYSLGSLQPTSTPSLELNARNLSGAVPWVLKCTEFQMWVKLGDFLSHHLCASSCIPSSLVRNSSSVWICWS